MSVTTEIGKDIYGNTTSIRQYGTQNGYTSDVTRYFWYDSRLRLCRERAPEWGDNAYEYDALDRISAFGKGQGAASCGTAIASADKVTLTYDALSRETYRDFGDATPDISTSYDNNGNVTAKNRGGANWSYWYNDQDLTTFERLQIDSRTYDTGYGYDGETRMVWQSYPSGMLVAFYPDGLGRPTTVLNGSTYYASGMQYHRNRPPNPTLRRCG